MMSKNYLTSINDIKKKIESLNKHVSTQQKILSPSDSPTGIAKLLSLQTGASSDDHGRLAARLLHTREQPELAEISYRHLLFCLIDETRRPQSWEQKVVYFADKLVEKSQLASLEERVQGLRERYPNHRQEIDAVIPALLELQDEICAAADVQPDELLPCLNNALLGGE